MSPICPTITRVHSDDPIAKRFRLDPASGDLVKLPSESQLASGEAEVVDTPSAAALATILERMGERDVLILGRPRGGLRTAKIKTVKRVKGMGAEVATERGIISRSSDYFEYAPGPGWILIDHDTKAMPEDVRARVEGLGGGLAALAHIWPDVLKATRVFKPSSSGGVYIEGESPRAATGFHLFVLVEDVSRSAEALQALQARAWAAGLAFYMVGRAGQRLERSIVDTAVGTPERVIYTGPPELGPGVFRDPLPLQVWEGVAVPVPSAPAPQAWEPNRDAAHRALEPEAVRVTVTKRGVSETEAREMVRRNNSDGGDLGPDALIYGPGGGLIRVRDLVASVSRPCRVSLPDPFEGPDYGRTTASLIWDKGHAAPIILSHAHGVRTRYRLPEPERISVTPQNRTVTPAQEVWGITPTPLKDRRTDTLAAALAAVTDVSQVGTVLAVAAALANRTPAQMGREDVVAFLRDHLPPGAIPADWISAIMSRIDWTQDKRRDRALASVRISAAVRKDLDVVTVPALAALDQIEGVTVVKAPMAAGKTQTVARPWVEDVIASQFVTHTVTGQTSVTRNDWRGVWAVCHRVALVEELAQRLSLSNYREGTPEPQRAAICLPSITLDPFASSRPDFLFIDEIEQVMRFLRSQECCRTAKARTPDKVFDRLVEVIRKAKGIMVADAGANDDVIAFLRHCRPGDPIRLIEMAEPEDAGITATFLSGEKGVYGAAVDQAAETLNRGERVWIAQEGAQKAEEVAAFLRTATQAADTPIRVLCITGKNKGGDDQAAFLRDPENESRRWDCVVASPVIASGISIEHKGAPHFHLGVYLGAGQAVTPADAAQQLRRVRYLRRFVIAIAQNNKTGGRTVESILSGRAEAAADEGLAVGVTFFDRLIAGMDAREADARADFAAGLWWTLESMGWKLTREAVADGDAASALRKIAKDHAEDRIERLIAASRDLENHKASDVDTLRRTGASGPDADLVEAWHMTQALGIAELTAEDVAFCDAGGLAHLDRFDDLAGNAPALTDRDREAVLSHRRLRIARAKHYAEIFAGHDPLSPDPWLTREIAGEILARVMRRADAYAASGAIPAKYAARFGRPAPTPPRDPVKAVQEIFARAGLRTVSIQTREHSEVSQIPPDSVSQSGGICDTAPSQTLKTSVRVRRYAANPDTVAAMQRRVSIRAAAQDMQAHPAHIEAVKRLIDSRDSGSDLSQGARIGLRAGLREVRAYATGAIQRLESASASAHLASQTAPP